MQFSSKVSTLQLIVEKPRILQLEKRLNHFKWLWTLMEGLDVKTPIGKCRKACDWWRIFSNLLQKGCGIYTYTLVYMCIFPTFICQFLAPGFLTLLHLLLLIRFQFHDFNMLPGTTTLEPLWFRNPLPMYNSIISHFSSICLIHWTSENQYLENYAVISILCRESIKSTSPYKF